MFKATLDGNGIVVYSDQPNGELVLDVDEYTGEPNGFPVLHLDPSMVLKGPFVVRNNWSAMASSDRPQQMYDFRPFDMLRFAPVTEGTKGNVLLKYLLDRHPDLFLLAVEVEYREIPATTKPVALTMQIWRLGNMAETPNVVEPFFFREPTGSSEWQIAHLNLLGSDITQGGPVCPFKNLAFAEKVEGEVSISHPEVTNCFQNVGLWASVANGGSGAKFLPPVFYICGGVIAVRRISFFFASSQFWSEFTNSAELIQLYERPVPPDPGDPDDIVVFNYSCRADAYYNEHPNWMMWMSFPTPDADQDGAMNLFSGLNPPWPDPFSITSVDGDPEGVAVLYADGNNVKWHYGSEGGLFRFYEDGYWRFDADSAFDDLSLGQTRDTSIDFEVHDEFEKRFCRITVTVIGV
jgi:hypothetical protein